LKLWAYFVEAVVALFGKDYLRGPNEQNTTRILAQNAARGFHKRLGSKIAYIGVGRTSYLLGNDCTKDAECTVILEAVVHQDLWILHAFIGMTGTHNDINMLQCSPIFVRLTKGQAHVVNFEINDNNYNKGYYLADDIYLQ
jgi:hypothetical protein